MKTEDKKHVALAIAKQSQKVTLKELAAKGKRHIHVISAKDALRAIEAVVDENLAENGHEGEERAQRLEKAMEHIQNAFRDRGDAAASERFEAFENKIREELRELKSSLKSLDGGLLTALSDELSKRAEAKQSALEARLETTLNATVDVIRRTVTAAMRGSQDCSVEETDLLISTLFDDQKSALESNVGSLQVREASTAKGVTTNLARLKELQKKVRVGGVKDKDTVGEESESSASRSGDAAVTLGKRTEE